MSSSINKQIQKTEQLILHGELRKALEIIEEGIRRKDISKEDMISFLLRKSECVFYLGDFQESIQLANRVLKESEGLDNTLDQIDALFQKAWSLLSITETKELEQIVKNGLKIITTTNLPEKKAFEEKAKLLYIEAFRIALLGDFSKSFELHQEGILLAEKSGNKYITALLIGNLGALHLHFDKPERSDEYTEKALAIATEMGYKFQIAFHSINLAAAKSFRRDFEQSIKLYEEAFALAEEIGSTFLLVGYYDLGNTYLLMFQLDKALESYKKSLTSLPLYEHITLPCIGYIYYLKYELEKAKEYYLKSLKISERLSDNRTIADVLYNLILISIELGNVGKAQKYLDRLEEISMETSFEYVKYRYHFASILVLKISGDISNLGKAAELLKTFLKEKNLSSKLRLDGLYALLEIRLKELQLSANKEVLEEVQKRLNHLEIEAEDQEQKWLLANVYRLQSQLSLVELNANKAIELLQKAQAIADEIDVGILKKEISEDKEKIEKQLAMWKNLQEKNAPISETFKHVSLESIVKNIKEETVIEEKDKETGEIIEYRKLFALKI